MIRVRINKVAYLVPQTAQEATLAFYERIHLLTPEATAEQMIAQIIGCKESEVTGADGFLSNRLYDVYVIVGAWFPKWAGEMQSAPTPKTFNIFGKSYGAPKNWMLHQFRSHIQISQWLQEPNRPTLVSDVISLYLAPVVFGVEWTDEQREDLRGELLGCKATDIAPLFFYALRKLQTFKTHGIKAFVFRLLRWILARRMRWA